MPAAGRAQDGRLNVLWRHRTDGGEERPLVGIGTQCRVHKHAAAVLARLFLQWQCNQVAESSLWHRVLIGEETVIGLERQLPGAGAGVADDRGTQSAGVAGGNASGKEQPCVRTVTGARNFECDWHAQCLTGLNEGLCIFAPLGFIKIYRQEMRRIVGQ